MGGYLSTSNGDESKIPKGIGQETTLTTAKPLLMISPPNYKETNSRPGRYGNNCGSIKTYGKFSIKMHEQYTETR